MKVFPPILDVLRSEGKEQEEGIVKAKESLKYLEEELKGKKFFGERKLDLQILPLDGLRTMRTCLKR